MRLRHSLNLVYYVLRKLVEFIESNVFIRFFSMAIFTIICIFFSFLFFDYINKIEDPIIQIIISFVFSVPAIYSSLLFFRSFKMITDKILYTEISILDEIFDNTLGLILKGREENDK